MPSKSERVRLADIVQNIELAEGFVDGLNYDQFLDNTQVFYAATRCLEIISEASRRLSPELKARHAIIPWDKIAGSGNVYRHDYEDVAHRQVWQTIHEFLPDLHAAATGELAAIKDEREPKEGPPV